MITSLPWWIEEYDGSDITLIRGVKGELIANVLRYPLEHKENARMIVNAVNSYEAMKEACEAALANVSPMYSSHHHVVKLLNRALTLANGGQ